MTILIIVRLLMIVGICGAASAVAARTTHKSSQAETWAGNILTLIWMGVSAIAGWWYGGLGLIAMVISAFACGYKFSPGLVYMRRGEKAAASKFIFFPLLTVAAVVGGLTAVYLLLAGVFAVFPLPFQLPFSTVPSFFGFFLRHESIRTWIIYGLGGYLAITGGTVAKIIYPDLKARLKQRRDAKAAKQTTQAPPAAPGTLD